jgi:hypothetical protein
MNKLFLILAIVSNMAHADTWVMPNNGGGQIVLSDRKCPGHPTLFEVYSYTNNVYLTGCWAVVDGKIHVVWDKGQGRRVYEMNDFVPDQTTPKKKGTSL